MQDQPVMLNVNVFCRSNYCEDEMFSIQWKHWREQDFGEVIGVEETAKISCKHQTAYGKFGMNIAFKMRKNVLLCVKRSELIETF